jgi:DNA-binding transcriptional MocR family regulator
MSVAGLRYALTVPKLTSSERLLFVMLADRADKNGNCFPSQEWMAKRTGLSLRTVVRAMKGLVEKGHMARQKRNSAAGRSSDLLTLRLPSPSAKLASTNVPNSMTIPSSPYGVDKKGRKGGYQAGATGEVIAFPLGSARGQQPAPAGKQTENLADLHDIQSYLEVPLS